MKIAVIGSGPVGLYAAHQLVKEGHSVVIFERSPVVAGNVRSWGFVQLFSPLELNVPPSARETLAAKGTVLPALSDFLTGDEFAERVLEPLADWLRASGRCELRLGCEVLSIGRERFLKTEAIAAVGDKRRTGKPFRLLFRSHATDTEAAESGFAKVVDASGSYGAATGNRVGVGGMLAPGERKAEASGRLLRVIPDVKGTSTCRKRLVSAGGRPVEVKRQRVAVIGTGYSAITALRNLVDLAEEGGEGAPASIFWLTRAVAGKAPYSILASDPLPQRSELAKFGNELAGRPCKFNGTTFEYVPAMAVGEINEIGGGVLRLALELADGEAKRDIEVDVVLSLTGYRPDKELWSELQIHTCYASDGPMKMAASLLAAKVAAEGDPAAAGDCLKQAAPGRETLLSPEPDFYIVGMKSYGRNSTFLMRAGYEQVHNLMEELKMNANL